MPLVLYDTLTRCKREFQPVDEGCVRVYVCGPTVYAEPHIGNARPAVVFDVLVRLLRRNYPKVKYVRNITDVDDKILDAAAKGSKSPEEIAQKYTRVYYADMKALGVMRPDIEPKVTENMEAILSMIKHLIDKGHAYEAEGHVLFDVNSYKFYGELSKRDREGMIAGARVETAPYKRDPGDFVLWKPSTLEQVGWESAWGRGRPGWHIECSAMIKEHLGETIDIHGGGIDLIFPHHENECAQSFCAHQNPLANYWMHNGFVNMEKEKMSKSEGNIITVGRLLEWMPGEVIRYALLSTHYRKPFDWSRKLIVETRHALERIYRAAGAARGVDTPVDDVDMNLADGVVLQALEDDLNTPKALQRLYSLASEIFHSHNISDIRRLGDVLVASGKVMGLLQSSSTEWVESKARTGGSYSLTQAVMRVLLDERDRAREQGDFVTADRIRERLARVNIIVEDTPEGPKWQRHRERESQDD